MIIQKAKTHAPTISTKSTDISAHWGQAALATLTRAGVTAKMTELGTPGNGVSLISSNRKVWSHETNLNLKATNALAVRHDHDIAQDLSVKLAGNLIQTQPKEREAAASTRESETGRGPSCGSRRV